MECSSEKGYACMYIHTRMHTLPKILILNCPEMTILGGSLGIARPMIGFQLLQIGIASTRSLYPGQSVRVLGEVLSYK